jgi:hypothetical protein
MKSRTFRFARMIGTILALLAVLGMVTPSAAAHQGGSTSDLAIRLVSAPNHARACGTFKQTYVITNRGPNRAKNVNVGFSIPDPFSVIKVIGAPVNLAPGKSVKVIAFLKVVAFVPGESRNWTITANVWSEVYPKVSIDPRPGNNSVTSPIKLVGKQVLLCP